MLVSYNELSKCLPQSLNYVQNAEGRYWQFAFTIFPLIWRFQAQGGTWKDVSICIYVINYFLGKSPDYFRVFISILSVLS